MFLHWAVVTSCIKIISHWLYWIFTWSSKVLCFQKMTFFHTNCSYITMCFWTSKTSHSKMPGKNVKCMTFCLNVHFKYSNSSENGIKQTIETLLATNSMMDTLLTSILYLFIQPLEISGSDEFCHTLRFEKKFDIQCKVVGVTALYAKKAQSKFLEKQDTTLNQFSWL